MKLYQRVLFAFIVVMAIALGSSATVTMPSIFGDHMVLQQGKSLPLWGRADPGETVCVSLGKQQACATACAEGRWMVKLPKMKTGGPYELNVQGTDNTLRFTDVLLGEVWLGSGQSNMQWPVNRSANPELEIVGADYPDIRLFSVTRTVATVPEDDCEGTWTICSPETIPEFSAVLYYFGRELHQQLNGFPIGLIHSSWGGTPAESWTSRPMLEGDPDLVGIVQKWDELLAEYPAAKATYDTAVKEWEHAAEQAKAAGEPEPRKPDAPRGPEHPWLASGLYNAMIHPLVPYAVRGAVWYQGESNANRAWQYRKLFPAMITDWRNAWGQGDFSFYFVQLANFRESLSDPTDSDWAELREAQTMTLSLKNTGMAVSIDIGEADDIHPKNKQDVGKRLALNALAKDYGRNVAWSGPMYRSMRIWRDKVTITFNHAQSGLTTSDGDAPKGFAIAGTDGRFVWADAEIKGKRVVLSSPKVLHPVAVRYAWAINPVCNLVNGKGLPASPFRTDQWPGVTMGNE